MNEATAEIEELREAIEELYSVFARNPLKKLYGCDHCVFPQEQQVLEAKPLRELTSSDLRSYANAAPLTFGDVEDLKHFLPRILELLALDTEWIVDPDLLMKRLGEDADWRNWPDSEQEAVQTYLYSWWRFRITSFPTYLMINECL